MLSHNHRALVRDSWALVVPIKSQAAALFYNRLFELDPSLRPLFAHSDLDAQGVKLMQMLDVAVAQLDKPDLLLPAVQALGRRHAGYGVRAEHYDTVAQALLWTLEHGLGGAFTPAVRDAWTLTYGALAQAMQRPRDAEAA